MTGTTKKWLKKKEQRRRNERRICKWGSNSFFFFHRFFRCRRLARRNGTPSDVIDCRPGKTPRAKKKNPVNKRQSAAVRALTRRKGDTFFFALLSAVRNWAKLGKNYVAHPVSRRPMRTKSQGQGLSPSTRLGLSILWVLPGCTEFYQILPRVNRSN